MSFRMPKMFNSERTAETNRGAAVKPGRQEQKLGMRFDRLRTSREVPDRTFRFPSTATSQHNEASVSVIAHAFGPLPDFPPPERLPVLRGAAMPLPLVRQPLAGPSGVCPGILDVDVYHRSVTQFRGARIVSPVFQKLSGILGS